MVAGEQHYSVVYTPHDVEVLAGLDVVGENFAPLKFLVANNDKA